MGVGHLEDEARLADARLAADGCPLTAAVSSLFQGTAELLDFGIPTYKAREPASGGGLEARSHRTDPCELVDLNSGRQAFHGHGTQGRHLYETLRWREGVRGQED